MSLNSSSAPLVQSFSCLREPADIKVRPRGVAVTIGVGSFQELAQLAARRMAERTGLDTVILGPDHLKESGLESPLFLKFRIFDLVKAENVLYFDADMVCLEQWDPSAWFGGPSVVAVRERMLGLIVAEAANWGIPLPEYFNAGMFIANAMHHGRWLKLAESIRFERPTHLPDQSPINAARYRLDIPLKLLNRRFNWLGFGASCMSHEMPVVIAHKLAPYRIDLNLAYLRSEYKLLAPRIVLDETEANLLAGRTLTWIKNGADKRRIMFRGDGVLLPLAEPEDAGYWFVHVVKDRPTLALASETRVLHEFMKFGGDWRNTGPDKSELINESSNGIRG